MREGENKCKLLQGATKYCNGLDNLMWTNVVWCDY